LRAPIALAVAKLLNKLPPWVMSQHLDGLILTLKRVLLSRSPGIRKNARILLEQLMRLLGPRHLAFVIGELKQTMRKGYQIPVMALTVFVLISSLDSQMTSGDIDASLKDIIEVSRFISIPYH
jgi:U3 small nucleolar RNA-associated protein 20